MSTDNPRKAFFVKLGGLIMAAAVLPKLFTRSGSSSPTPAPIQLRSERRAVARQEGAI